MFVCFLYAHRNVPDFLCMNIGLYALSFFYMHTENICALFYMHTKNMVYIKLNALYLSY